CDLPLLAFHASTLRPPPSPTPFPYTTLFRSRHSDAAHARVARAAARVRPRGRQGESPAVARWHQRWGQRAGPCRDRRWIRPAGRSEEHTSELQSRFDLVCRLLLEKQKRT